MLPEDKTIQTVMTIVGTLVKGSTIDKQLQDYSQQPPNLVVPFFSSSSLDGKENVNPVSNGQALNSNSSLNHEISAPPSTVQCESEMAPLSTPSNDYDELQLQQISDCNVNNQQQEQNISSFIESTIDPSEVQLPTVQTETLFIETLTERQMQIEMATRGQSMNPAWFEQKQNRITASICKDVFSHMQKQGSKLPENLVKKITAKGAPPKMVSYILTKD